MNSNKHTPGPWIVEQPHDGDEDRGEAPNYFWQVHSRGPAGKRYRICELGSLNTAEVEHDAALIAAAPELLDALRRAVDALDALTDVVDGTGFSSADEFNSALDEIDLGRALIAKTTGGASHVHAIDTSPERVNSEGGNSTC